MEETNGSPMIEAVGLSKFYGEFAAIRDVTFAVPQGQVVAFLGPNGAGKSTTMKLLTGYLSPSEGTARIAGFDVASERIPSAARLGYLPDGLAEPRVLSNHLISHGQFHPHPLVPSPLLGLDVVQQFERGYLLAHSFESHGAEGNGLDPVPHLVARGAADNDLPPAGQRLEPGSEVHRVADDGVLDPL